MKNFTNISSAVGGKETGEAHYSMVWCGVDVQCIKYVYITKLDFGMSPYEVV